MTDRFTRVSTAASAIAIVLMMSGQAAPAQAQPLAPHRAVYDVELDEASERSGIAGMNGRIVYEFQGSSCDGYTTSFRFVSRIRSNGGDRVTDQQTSTYEDGAGETFRFVTKSFVDEKLDRELRGTAKLSNGSTLIELDKPDPAEFVLERALFPTAHILDLLERADAGETIYEEKIFDGSEDGDETMTTTVVLGPEKSGADGDAANAGPLKDEPYRNVSISYFAQDSGKNGEGLPEYAIAFKLYDNGVTRDLVMDYGDFSLTGELTQLDMLPPETCQ